MLPNGQKRQPHTSQEKRRRGQGVFMDQLRAKKMPQSERSMTGRGDADDLDEVVFLRLPAVKAVTGLSKTTLYALIHEKSFPAPVHLGPRTVAWVKSEVRQWAVARVQASRSAA